MELHIFYQKRHQNPLRNAFEKLPAVLYDMRVFKVISFHTFTGYVITYPFWDLTNVMDGIKIQFRSLSKAKL